MLILICDIEISAPRGFGEKFAQTYVKESAQKLLKPSKKLDQTILVNMICGLTVFVLK